MKKKASTPILLVLVVAAMTGCGRRPTNSDTIVSDMVYDKWDVDTNSFELYRDYESNQASANTKYGSKIIRVRGSVYKINGENGGYVVEFANEAPRLGPGNTTIWPPPSITCEINKNSFKSLTEYKKADQITLVGKIESVTNKFNNKVHIKMSNCTVVK